MYPSGWDLDNEFNSEAVTSARLLRDAASRYKVMLQPISPIMPPASQNVDDETVYSEEELYPLTNLLSLLNYNRILYLQPSGLILSSSPLDLLFTYPLPEKRHMLAFNSPIPSSADRPALLLVEPSKALYQNTLTALPEGAFLDTEFLALLHTTPAPPSTPNENTRPAMLLAETSDLHSVDAGFNSTEFLDTAGYVHIQDDGVPGPEFAPDDAFVKGGPSRKEAKVAWEGVYERYREGRTEICGLDLQTAPRRNDPKAIQKEDELGEVASGHTASDMDNAADLKQGDLAPLDEEEMNEDASIGSVDMINNDLVSEREDLR